MLNNNLLGRGEKMKQQLIFGIIIISIAWIFSTILAGKMAGKTGVVLYIIYGLLIISPFVFALIGLQQGWIEG